jgi:hypothetical protein
MAVFVDDRNMEVFFFMSKPDHKVFGFTLDSVGANLPRSLAPWEAAGSVSSDINLNGDVTATIKRDGFFLAKRPTNLH